MARRKIIVGLRTAACSRSGMVVDSGWKDITIGLSRVMNLHAYGTPKCRLTQ